MADAKTEKKKVVRKPAGPKSVYITYEGIDERGKLVNAKFIRKADELLEAVENGAKYTKLVVPAGPARAKKDAAAA